MWLLFSRDYNRAQHYSRRGSGFRTVEYRTWGAMNSRCTNPNDKLYPFYGGRGIGVAAIWKGDGGYECFVNHIGRCPGSTFSIDRIDNERGYEPGNVRWATKRQQANNRRNTILVTIENVTLPLTVWCERKGLKYKTVHQRIRKGWTETEALRGSRHE